MKHTDHTALIEELMGWQAPASASDDTVRMIYLMQTAANIIARQDKYIRMRMASDEQSEDGPESVS
jgi:hypothetical protein